MANIDIIAIGFGISPLKRLFLRFRFTNFSHEAMLDGMIPEKWFEERSSTESEGQSWNWPGISPSKLFLETMKVCKLGMERMVEGREEWRRFRERSMKESDVEEEISFGIRPVILLLANSNL
ncbi:hypothetical protein PanWU01x14_267660 [Parasponia andersonii]|uniref:Uncharacterized protein n=1 Tax=Parasponia andersonii TaxID=3476 RepID=A0A2P5B6H1_PARAD|nr:hypothetical protein PanWU01x14_267660 [Parasponia andersonii]